MRRHFLFPREDAAEPSVGGDAAQSKSLLRRWLERRERLAADSQVAQHVTFFWDVAKTPACGELQPREYTALFSRVAAALIDAIRSPGVADAVARRDWLYDSHGLAWSDSDDHPGLSFELFQDALLQVAELLLPVESDASTAASFFLELRECVAFPPGLDASDADNAAGSSLLEAASYALRPVRDVRKIRGAFLQRAPPNRDKLADVAGLPPPDSRRMSLKQLLLSYNPRKLALSRAFSALARLEHSDDDAGSIVTDSVIEKEQPEETDEEDDDTAVTLPLPSARLLNAQSDDHWDPELAFIHSLETFPAPRVAVVGAPFSGKTRFANLLASKMRLRYLSLENSVQIAVDALRQRRQRYQSRVRKEEDVSTEEEGSEAVHSEAEAADATETPESRDVELETPAEADTPEVEAAQEAEQEERDPLADLFTAKDLDSLLAGLTFPRDKAIRLLVHFATASLLAGVGVVIDDVHPLELRGAIGIDFLVSLRAGKADLKKRATGLACAPVSRIMYSARELVTLRLASKDSSGGTADPLCAMGFADTLADDDDKDKAPQPANTRTSPQEDVASLPSDGPDDPSDGDADTPLESSRSQQVDEDAENVLRVLTAIERNGILPPSEPLVPLRSLFADFYDARYREYQERVKTLKRSDQRADDSAAGAPWHEIPILALQSLSSGINQCVETMFGNNLGISRTNASRRATPVNLPAALAPIDDPDGTASISRADQMRCLLFDEWGDAIDRANDEINGDSPASLALPGLDEIQTPTRAPRWRRLSRWREFCPVTSAHEQRLVLGTPVLAATLAGRVYIFATSAARDVFCAHPLQFLRRDPASLASPPAKVWLLHASSGDGTSQSAMALLVMKIQQALSLPLVSPLDVLASAPDGQRAVLAGGGLVSALDAAQLVASGISTRGDAGWLLADMPLTLEVVNELQTSGCLPDVVIALDDSANEAEQEDQDGAVATSALYSIRAKALLAQLDTAERVLAPLGVAFRRCSIPRRSADDYVEDALAVVLAAVNPLAPRVDRAEDGHVPADLLAIPLAPSDPNDESTTTLVASMLAPPSPAPTPASCLLGETHRFCPVSWRQCGVLVPGLPSFVSCFRQRVYAFAGRAEQRAFDRNPARYLPSAPRETALLVPLVLLVGVRGSGVRRIAETLTGTRGTRVADKVSCRRLSHSAKSGTASSTTSTASASTMVMVDVAAVERAIGHKRKLAALRSDGDGDTSDANGDARAVVEALHEHVEGITAAWRQRIERDPAAPKEAAAVIVMPGIPSLVSSADGGDGAEVGDAADDPVVPSEELLTACFTLGLFPALVLPLEASESVVIQRRLVPWLAKEQASRDRRALDRVRARAVASRKTKRGRGDSDGTETEEEEEEEEEVLVDLETARAEQAEKLASEFLADQEAMTRALEVLRERGIRVAPAIPADGSERQRVKLVDSAITALSARKDTLFSPCYPLWSSSSPSAKAARERDRQQTLLLSRLASGELAVGKHDTRCPVTETAALTRVRSSEDLLSRPVVYRDRVYFPGSDHALARFCARPWAFVDVSQRSTVPPPHPLACTLKGGPHTPTTRLARQIAWNSGAVYVSLRSAIKWVTQCLGGTALWECFHAMEQAGVDPVQDSAVVRAAVLARLQSADCVTHGWVLDDYVLMPDAGDSRRMPDAHTTEVPSVQVEPGLLLIVDQSFQSAWARAQQHSTPSPFEPSVPSLVVREQLAAEFSAWQKERLELMERWTTTYGDPLVQILPLDHIGGSSCEINGGVCFWKLVGSACAYVERHLAQVRHHRQLQVASQGRGVCAVRGIPRALAALTARCHPSFETFCPVELRAGRYVATPSNSRALCVDYGENSFWLASAGNLEAFANDPDSFVGEEAAMNARALLDKAPVDASVLSLITVADCDFPELKGYCPVTFASSKNAANSADGPRANWATIVKGSVFFRASYEHKVFLMASEAARRQFLLDPSRYTGLKLPMKLPPQVMTALATNYPGRLEQELGALLQDALLSLGSVRPKFPGASVASSACVFLALSLQERRRTMPHKKQQDPDDELESGETDQHHASGSADDAAGLTLVAFERDCQLSATLRRALTPCSPSCGPAVRGVRELLASSSSSTSLQPVGELLQDSRAVEPESGSGATDSLENARHRFDAITRSDDDARRAFFEYATSAATKKRQRLGIHLSS